MSRNTILSGNVWRTVYSASLKPPLLIFWLGGFISILLDVDHLLAVYMGWANKRPLHIPVAIVVGIIWCGVHAYYLRLYFKSDTT